MINKASFIKLLAKILRRTPGGRYAAFREFLRIIIPYEWRRKFVILRDRLGLMTIAGWPGSILTRYRMSRRQKPTGRGDFYETVTIRPHVPLSETESINTAPCPMSTKCMPDVICFSIVDWSFRYQRPQQLMSQFALHGHRVFYLSPSAGGYYSLKEIRKNLYEVQPAMHHPEELFRSAIQGTDIETVMRSLEELRRSFNIINAICYVMIASWNPVAIETRKRWGWRVIYDCMDEWENFPGIGSALPAAERELVRECDLLVVTAQKLYDKWVKETPRIILARNGVDYDFYRRNLKPNELLGDVKRPVIGYFGAIADWFDTELLAETARKRPDYTFVLLGDVFNADIGSLMSLDNVIILGRQPYETMPQYLYAFDACIIPFKLNSVTESTDPVKLYEYLSGGKPVISVRLPEIEQYGQLIYVADSPDEFAEKIDRALDEDNSQLQSLRVRFAQHNTWADRYEKIMTGFKKISPRAGIIIVTYNNLALTKLCIESVIRNTDYPDYEIIIVDNASTDGTPEFLSELSNSIKNIKFIANEKNEGFARANNQGIDISDSEFLVLLNNDTIVTRGWLSRLVFHLNDERVGLVGPVTSFAGNEARIDVDYRTWAEMERFAAEHILKNQLLVADIDMLAMFCLAMRRELYDRVGPLDEQFGLGMFEDDDYSMRVRKLGYRVICAADVFVHHFGQAAFSELIRCGRYDRLFNENRQKYEAKWKTTWTPHKHARLVFSEHKTKFFNTWA